MVIAFALSFKYTRIVFEIILKVNPMISKKQKQVYDFIASYSQEHGVSPSLKEIAEHFDFLQYPSSAHYHVTKLQDEGYLERESNKPRSIGIYADRTVKTPFLKKIGMDAVRVPVLGAANAGPATLFAEGNISGYLKVSRTALNRRNGVFALRVEGDSMNRAKVDGKNLEQGDFVLIDSEYKTPRDGDYVLSVMDGCANLKKFQRDAKTGNIALLSESKNPKHKPIYVSSEDDFMVNGKIIGVVKR